MKGLHKQIGIASIVFATLISSTLLFSSKIGGQTKGSVVPINSSGSMQGVTPERTRLYNTAELPEPKSVLWQSEKLFYLKETESFSGSMGTLSYFGWYPTGYNFSNPIMSDGVIYFTLSVTDGYLFALNSADGKQKTKFRLKATKMSAPAIAGDLVYLGASDGSLMAMNRADGKAKWGVSKKDYRFDVASPVVVDGIAYFAGEKNTNPNNINIARGDGVVAALDALTGEGRWVFPLKGFPTSAAISGDTMIFGDEDNHAFGVNRRTGTKNWTFKADGNILSPAIAGDFAYFTDENGHLYSVNTESGSQAWRADKSLKLENLVAVNNGTVYCAGKGKNLYAFDAATGKEKWEFKTNYPCNSPIIAGGLVYVLSLDKYFYAVDAAEGQLKWRYKMPHNAFSAPIIANGVAYLLDEDGYMYAIK